MKITIKHYDTKHSFEIPDDSHINDVMTEICSLIYATGFHMESIENWIIEKAEELNNKSITDLNH